MTRQASTAGFATRAATMSRSSASDRVTTRPLSTAAVWKELSKASFAIISHVTPSGEPRSSGVVYGVHDRRLYVAVAADSLKAQQITGDHQVAVTVPVRRGGLLSLLFPIPPATVTFHTRAILHPPGSLELGSISKKLASLLPKGRQDAVVLELVPQGRFLTYGIGVSLRQMIDPSVARAHVPVA